MSQCTNTEGIRIVIHSPCYPSCSRPVNVVKYEHSSTTERDADMHLSPSSVSYASLLLLSYCILFIGLRLCQQNARPVYTESASMRVVPHSWEQQRLMRAKKLNEWRRESWRCSKAEAQKSYLPFFIWRAESFSHAFALICRSSVRSEVNWTNERYLVCDSVCSSRATSCTTRLVLRIVEAYDHGSKLVWRLQPLVSQ